jgi:hypothetical protein
MQKLVFVIIFISVSFSYADEIIGSLAILNFQESSVISNDKFKEYSRGIDDISKMDNITILDSIQIVEALNTLDYTKNIHELFNSPDDAGKLGKYLHVDYLMMGIVNLDSIGFHLSSKIISSRSSSVVSVIDVYLEDVFSLISLESQIAMWELLGKNTPGFLKQERINALPKNGELIVEAKTPLGAMWRSAVLPGWGQFYSEKRNTGIAFPSLEGLLASLLLYNVSKYNTSVENMNKFSSLYHSSTNEEDIINYRNESKMYWKQHIDANNAMILLAKSAGVIWAINAIHAYMIAPRPKANLYGPDPPDSPSIIKFVSEFLSE